MNEILEQSQIKTPEIMKLSEGKNNMSQAIGNQTHYIFDPNKYTGRITEKS